MHAVTQTVYGGPEVLSTTQVARPEISENQILVEVRASALAEGDRRLRAADFPGISAVIGRLMFGLRGPRAATGGTTFAGRVVEVGAQVTRFRIGDRVFGGTMNGAHAEYLAVEAEGAVTHLPKGIAEDDAVAMIYGAGTALCFLERAELRAGERVLIIGASGGVGRYAVQVAKALGAHVSAAVRDDGSFARRMGADEVIDTRSETFDEDSYDVIFDTRSGYHFAELRGHMRSGGRYVSVDASPRLLLQMLWTKLTRNKRRALTGVVMESRERLERIAAMTLDGQLEPAIASRFPLRNIVAAHQMLEAPDAPRGTIVIEPYLPKPNMFLGAVA